MCGSVGPTEATRTQISPVQFGGEYTPYEEKNYSLRNVNFVSRGLQRASPKIGKIFTLYLQELVKEDQFFVRSVRSL
jgi:hypothetical protein